MTKHAPPVHLYVAPGMTACGLTIHYRKGDPRWTPRSRASSCRACALNAHNITDAEREDIWQNANDRLDQTSTSPWKKEALHGSPAAPPAPEVPASVEAALRRSLQLAFEQGLASKGPDAAYYAAKEQARAAYDETEALLRSALSAARQEGRREGIEEAARWVDGSDVDHGWVACGFAPEIADGIRALSPGPGDATEKETP